MTDSHVPLAVDPLQPELAALLSTRAAPRGDLRQMTPVTDALRPMVTEAERIEIRARLDRDGEARWLVGEDVRRTRIELAAALGTQLSEVPLQEDDLESADVMVAALEAAGELPGLGSSAVDCGSGHAGRLGALGGARPDLRLRGVDGVDELPANGEADAVCGLDVLDTRDAHDAVLALGAMRRCLRPGGHAVLAVPGLFAIAAAIKGNALRGSAAGAALRDLYRTGHHHTGERAFATLDWFGVNAIGAWALLLFSGGAMSGDRDVLVLERRR
jgi:hypothetical protein